MKILIAVDSSPASMLAACAAATRPWPAGTTARVIHALEPPSDWTTPELEEAFQQCAEQAVANAAAYLRQAGLETSTAVLTGNPKITIVAEAEKWSAGLVFVGSHHSSGVMQFLLGGVSRAVAHLAACSVEIVRANPTPLRILLATDGSACSAAAARSVAERPWPAGASFRILSVVEPSAPLFHAPSFNPEMLEELRAKDMGRAQAAVSEAENILVGAQLETSSTVAVPVATPKELILSEAAEWGAGLIVLGSHGRRGMSRLLLGSVSEAVALHAPCSVEIIRHWNPA